MSQLEHLTNSARGAEASAQKAKGGGRSVKPHSNGHVRRGSANFAKEGILRAVIMMDS